MIDFPVLSVRRLDFAFAPQPWTFADARREEILAHFEGLRANKPSIFNGPVLLMHQHTLVDGVLSGRYLQTDFASFIAWRDWGFPDPSVINCFALGALRGSDGGFLLGVMGPQTANAGHIYFPGGTPDPLDIFGDRVDLERSVAREVEEETGLSTNILSFTAAWTVVLAGPRIALIKLMQAREPAQDLRYRILRHLRSEEAPELADMHIARGPADLDARVPDFVIAYLRHMWNNHQPATSSL
jgi:8-oxo-dGTP pyrophosphatase MutT (NUDIX family)